MSRTFFTSLGHHFLQKHAGRIPWPTLLQALRQEHYLPEFMPHIPFIEPEPLPPPPELAQLITPIGPAIPEEFVAPKEEAAPEPRPKSKPEDGKTSNP